ncbi:hypothetical protein [Cohnella soli]|uniref:Uncharacterized protein n=1 Tax=Cohnella soli TaxID=425005 RepID=A0ABW0HPX7_9BACL
MKSVKFLMSIVLFFAFAMGTVSAKQQVEEKQFDGLKVLNETTEVEYLENGIKVTTIRKELAGGIEDLENLIRIEEEKKKSDEKLFSYSKLGNNVVPMSIPTAQEARSWNDNNIMMQIVGHNGQSLTIQDLSWKVLADVVTYQTPFSGKTATNLKTKSRLQVNMYGVVLGTQVFMEQKLYEGTEGTDSSSAHFSANGGGAFVYVSAYIGGDFSYKSGTTPYSSTRWWNDSGYVSL